MSNRLMRFLIDLSKDPSGMEAFSQDPDLLLSRADLSEEEKAVARSGDPERLSRYLGLEPGTLWASQKPMPVPPPPDPTPDPSPWPDPNPGPPKPPNPSPRVPAAGA